jgi:PKD repeat protein
MSQFVTRIALVVCVLVSIHRDAAAQSSSLAWDEDLSTSVTGFIVSIDGVGVDYGLSPLNSSRTCGCAIALPFSGGSHTLQVTAYNAKGSAPSSVLTVATVAKPGGPYTGTVNTPLSVNGSGSQNPTGSITSYAWNWGDGTSATSSSATTTHTYNNSGTFTVALTVTDNAGARATASTTATIAAAPTVDIPPVARDDSANVRRRGQSVTIPVLLNDSDADGDPLTILSTTSPQSGTVSVNGGTLVYTSGRRSGQYSFTYKISDGRGGTATATVRVSVTN